MTVRLVRPQSRSELRITLPDWVKTMNDVEKFLELEWDRLPGFEFRGLV